jgi:hypothetical protein
MGFEDFAHAAVCLIGRLRLVLFLFRDGGEHAAIGTDAVDGVHAGRMDGLVSASANRAGEGGFLPP